MFFYRLKNCITTLLALAVFLLAIFCAWGVRGTRFPTLEGQRSFYLDSPSSQAKIVESLPVWNFARVRGESVSLAMTKEEGRELIASLGGEILFEEETEGCHSYYAYAPKLYGGIWLGEYFVNLHVAVGEHGGAVGSPIIFGSF